MKPSHTSWLLLICMLVKSRLSLRLEGACLAEFDLPRGRCGTTGSIRRVLLLLRSAGRWHCIALRREVRAVLTSVTALSKPSAWDWVNSAATSGLSDLTSIDKLTQSFPFTRGLRSPLRLAEGVVERGLPPASRNSPVMPGIAARRQHDLRTISPQRPTFLMSLGSPSAKKDVCLYRRRYNRHAYKERGIASGLRVVEDCERIMSQSVHINTGIKSVTI